MSQSSDDTPTGPIGAARSMGPPPPRDRLAVEDRTRRWNARRDVVAGVLVIAAVFLPWNLYFGVGIPDSKSYLFAILGVATLLSLLSLVLSHVGPAKSSGSGRLRLLLNVPYLLLVLGFVGFDAFQTVRDGGTVNVPGGIGPGGWLGLAGCLLSAQPVITSTGDGSFGKWLRAAKVLGYASMFGAALSAGFNLSWRIRFALQPAAGASGFGEQNIAVITAAVVYGVVATVAVLVASRWLLKATKDFRLSTVALGASTAVAGVIVWLLPVGREIDAFHGIAQNTSTAGVGYEGYLAWVAAAAIFAPRTLSEPRRAAADEGAWRSAARHGLLLIAIWCVGSVLMRLTDLGVAVVLNYPFSRYDSLTLAAFDLITAVLAIWLRVNLVGKSLPTRLISALSGSLFTLTVARVIVGVVLAPRFASAAASQNPVYGNDLAQQITSTFDVVLCGLALFIFCAAIITGQLRGRLRRRRRRPAAAARAEAGAVAPRPPAHAVPSEAHTTRFSAAGSPRIFRGDDSATRQIAIHKPKIYRPPGGST